MLTADFERIEKFMQELLKKKFVFALLLVLTSLSLLNAQQALDSHCGISPRSNEIITDRLLLNQAVADESPVRFRSVNYVPVKFHLVAESDGSERVPFDHVLDQLCELNADFSELNMQFYIKDGFNLVDNSTINNNHLNAGFAMISRNDPEAINIWVVADASPSRNGNEGGIVAGYYDATKDKDWIIMRTDRIGAGQPILTHELGHYFSLLHTHRGWDSEPYDPEKHGVPAPARAPDGIATELRDGSNCQISGDRICDTPADYNGLGWPSCDFTPTVLDPNGEQIDPDERLHMGYFFNCTPDRYFSNEQKELIQTDYMSAGRRQIRTGETPAAAEITGFTTLTEPADGATTAGFNNVFLEWTPVTNATRYLVEIDQLPSFPNPAEWIAAENTLEVTGLEPGQRYFWRVRPFNEGATCAIPSIFSSFRTGASTNTNDLLQVDDFKIIPNPVDRNQNVQIELKTNRGFDARIQLHDITGQLVRDQGAVRFTNGKNTYRLPLNDIRPGVYLFSIQSELGRVTERIVVH